MKVFLIKSLLFFLLIGLFFISIPILKRSVVVSDYMAAIIDKHRRLDSITTPRMILAGGSNLAFGIDTKRLQDEFQVPVINLGLHAGLGLDFVLNELKENVRPNDVVFLSIEYFLSRDGSYEVKQMTSQFYPPSRNYYERSLITEMEVLLRRNQKILREYAFDADTIKTLYSHAVKAPIYSRKSFNVQGDVVGHLGEPDPGYINDRVALSYYRWDGIDQLNEFYEFAIARKISVFYLFPHYPKSEYKKNLNTLDYYEQDIKRELRIPVLNDVSDAIIPDSLFFDTVYHLKQEGRAERTARFVNSIMKDTQAVAAVAKLAGKQ